MLLSEISSHHILDIVPSDTLKQALLEIIPYPQQGITHGLNLHDFDNSVPYNHATVGPYILLYKKDRDIYYFSIDIDGIKAAFIVAHELTDIVDKKSIIIRRSYVHPRYRNTGVMTGMYAALHRADLRIFSDIKLSPESISIWKKLATMGGSVRAYDDVTHQYREIDASDYNQKKDTIHFVAESYSGGLYRPCKGITHDLILFLDDGLED